MTNKFSRRNFVTNAAMAGLFATGVTKADNCDEGKTNLSSRSLYPSTATQSLLDLLKVRIPIIQAPAGGVVSSAMTAAVSNSGGLGGIPLGWSSPEGAAESIAAVRLKTDKPFFANFVLHFGAPALPAALENGTRIIQFSWGMPDAAMISAIRSVDAVLGIQVTSKASAEAALALGADYLVCQGMEAGGHVHGSRPLAQALDEVLAVANEVPVVASGGISTGHKMREYIALGAAGVVMGSRFVASKESAAHEQYKEALVRAKAADTVFTTCMSKGWENATHRILRNSTFEMWESAGCPAPGDRPGETDLIATYANDPKKSVERYSINSPGAYYSGDLEAMAAYAGMGVDDITDVPAISEIVSRVWEEFLSGVER
jgi:nitronate monooxygenase